MISITTTAIGREGESYMYHGANLVNLSLLSRHSLNCMLRHLFLLLFCILLRNVGKRVIPVIVSPIKIIPGSIQFL